MLETGATNNSKPATPKPFKAQEDPENAGVGKISDAWTSTYMRAENRSPRRILTVMETILERVAIALNDGMNVLKISRKLVKVSYLLLLPRR